MFGDERYKGDLKHECELLIDDDVTYKYIDHGPCVTFRRQFRKWMLIDETNPRSRALYKSTFIITREKILHLFFYYYMIHPYSKFREAWEFAQSIVIILQLITTPLRIMLKNTILHYVSYACDALTVCDIIMSFNTGYFYGHGSFVIMRRKLVAKRYLKTTFILDVISLFSERYINLSYNITDYSAKYDTYLYTIKYIEFVCIVKWTRYWVLLLYMNRLMHSRQVSIRTMSVIKVVLSISLLVLWMSVLTYITSYDTVRLEFENSLHDSVMRAFYMLFLFGTIMPADDTGVLVVQMLCLFVGFVVELLILRYLMQSDAKYNSMRKYNQSVKQLEDYMRHKALPPPLKAKTLRYYAFRYEMNYYQEEQVMKVLGPQLLQEVMLLAHMHFFTEFPLFDLLPLQLLFGIIMSMNVEWYMPGDAIVVIGARPSAMFFIKTGSVAVYTIAGMESRHLAEGARFGELALMGDARHSPETIVAIDCCEIYVLQRANFMAQIEPHADVFVKVSAYMSDYVASYYNDDSPDV